MLEEERGGETAPVITCACWSFSQLGCPVPAGPPAAPHQVLPSWGPAVPGPSAALHLCQASGALSLSHRVCDVNDYTDHWLPIVSLTGFIKLGLIGAGDI